MNAERRNGAREPIRLSDHFSYGRLIRFTMPTIIMMIFTSIYSVVDGLFVSNAVGKTEFAALNFIFPFIMLFLFKFIEVMYRSHTMAHIKTMSNSFCYIFFTQFNSFFNVITKC